MGGRAVVGEVVVSSRVGSWLGPLESLSTVGSSLESAVGASDSASVGAILTSIVGTDDAVVLGLEDSFFVGVPFGVSDGSMEDSALVVGDVEGTRLGELDGNELRTWFRTLLGLELGLILGVPDGDRVEPVGGTIETGAPLGTSDGLTEGSSLVVGVVVAMLGALFGLKLGLILRLLDGDREGSVVGCPARSIGKDDGLGLGDHEGS